MAPDYSPYEYFKILTCIFLYLSGKPVYFIQITQAGSLCLS